MWQGQDNKILDTSKNINSCSALWIEIENKQLTCKSFENKIAFHARILIPIVLHIFVERMLKFVFGAHKIHSWHAGEYVSLSKTYNLLLSGDASRKQKRNKISVIHYTE